MYTYLLIDLTLRNNSYPSCDRNLQPPLPMSACPFRFAFFKLYRTALRIQNEDCNKQANEMFLRFPLLVAIKDYSLVISWFSAR